MKHRLLCFVLCSLASSVLLADEACDIAQIIAAVAPRLVRIDTIGGHEKIGDEFANEGTSSGVLLDRDGFVLTSAFNFLHDPASILLRFFDGSKKVARCVATDRNRMLTLLKVDDFNGDFIPEKIDIRGKNSLKDGEPCFVFGVALSQDEPNLVSGILSGMNRIWGKAVQTDAAVGPNNYGGPMVDREGRLIALAVPLSMTSNELSAGSETYDAGVGLAIPFEDIVAIVLPKLKQGKDIEPGTLGFLFKPNRTFVGEAIIDKIVPGLPADKAGLKVGDKILAVDDRPVASALECSMNILPRYVEETLSLTYLRNDESGNPKEGNVSLTTVPYPRQPDKDKPVQVRASDID